MLKVTHLRTAVSSCEVSRTYNHKDLVVGFMPTPLIEVLALLHKEKIPPVLVLAPPGSVARALFTEHFSFSLPMITMLPAVLPENAHHLTNTSKNMFKNFLPRN